MKYHYAIFLMYICLITGRCYSNIDIVNGVWLVSPMVTGNVMLAEKLLEIENLAKNKEWSRACPWDLPGKDTGVGYHFLF